MEQIPQMRDASRGAISMDNPLNMTSKYRGVSTTSQVHSVSSPFSMPDVDIAVPFHPGYMFDRDINWSFEFDLHLEPFCLP